MVLVMVLQSGEREVEMPPHKVHMINFLHAKFWEISRHNWQARSLSNNNNNSNSNIK